MQEYKNNKKVLVKRISAFLCSIVLFFSVCFFSLNTNTNNVNANSVDISGTDLVDYDLSFNLGSLMVIDQASLINPDLPPNYEYLSLSSFGSINLLYSSKNNNFRLFFPCVVDNTQTDFIGYSYFDFVSGRNYTTGFDFDIAFFDTYNLSSTKSVGVYSINLTRHNGFSFPVNFLYSDCYIENYCYVGSDGYVSNRISVVYEPTNEIYFQVFIKFDIVPSLNEYSRLYYTPILYYNLSYIFDNGYNNGYDTGYLEGHVDGEQQGLQNGYNMGYNDGYLEGEEQGLETGYESGYDDGLLDGSGMPIRIFDTIKSGVSRFLNTEILPNFTLSNALMIALGVSFFGFLLHLLIK